MKALHNLKAGAHEVLTINLAPNYIHNSEEKSIRSSVSPY